MPAKHRNSTAPTKGQNSPNAGSGQAKVKQLFAIVLAACSALVFATVAQAAPYSGLKERCKYTYGIGDYQSLSYSGATSCEEGSGLIWTFTNDGKRKPKVGTRTGKTPHSDWRCVTIRRKEVHGVIESTHRITCDRTGKPKARVRFFYES